MMARGSTGGFVEQPVRFAAGAHELFGVLTQPASVPSCGVGVVVATGGAYIPAPNRNRLSVRLARRLAQAGFPVVRFDFRGVGESTGAISGYRLDQPFTEDLEGAVQVLREAGARCIVPVGSCFGARTILAAADRIGDLGGAALISIPVRDFQMGDNVPARLANEMSFTQLLRRALRPHVFRSLFAPSDGEARLRTRWVYSRTAVLRTRAVLARFRPRRRPPDGQPRQEGPVSIAFLTSFRRLVNRGVPLLLLYGREEGFYQEFARAREHQLRDILASPRGNVTVDTVDGVVHGFTSVAVQDAVIERTERWVRALV